jgi:ribosomal protein S18 acetylase RimI-like enzyme
MHTLALFGSLMVKIRTLRRSDHEAYVKVHNMGYSTEEWFGILERAFTAEDLSGLKYDATFLAEVNDEVVGLLDIKIRGELADIENIVVLPEYRGRGIGNALLEKAIEFSAGKGMRQIRAEVPDQSKMAIRFYVKNRFRHLTDAYLVDIQGKSMPEHVRRCVHFVEDTRYWVPNEEQMKQIGRLGQNFSLVGKFKVMIRSLRS